MNAFRPRRLIPLSSIGGRLSGIPRSLDCFAARLKAGVLAMNKRTAIVTGAARRVGAAVARSLLADGWDVVAHVHRRKDDAPEGAVKVVADLADPGSAKLIFDAATGLPPVRLLVNNAARFAWDSLDAISPSEFDKHMRVNVRAPALLIDQLVAEHDASGALVVNILDSKLFAPNPDFLTYTLSKYALAALPEIAPRPFSALPTP